MSANRTVQEITLEMEALKRKQAKLATLIELQQELKKYLVKSLNPNKFAQACKEMEDAFSQAIKTDQTNGTLFHITELITETEANIEMHENIEISVTTTLSPKTEKSPKSERQKRMEELSTAAAMAKSKYEELAELYSLGSEERRKYFDLSEKLSSDLSNCYGRKSTSKKYFTPDGVLLKSPFNRDALDEAPLLTAQLKKLTAALTNLIILFKKQPDFLLLTKQLSDTNLTGLFQLENQIKKLEQLYTDLIHSPTKPNSEKNKYTEEKHAVFKEEFKLDNINNIKIILAAKLVALIQLYDNLAKLTECREEEAAYKSSALRCSSRLLSLDALSLLDLKSQWRQTVKEEAQVRKLNDIVLLEKNYEALKDLNKQMFKLTKIREYKTIASQLKLNIPFLPTLSSDEIATEMTETKHMISLLKQEVSSYQSKQISPVSLKRVSLFKQPEAKENKINPIEKMQLKKDMKTIVNQYQEIFELTKGTKDEIVYKGLLARSISNLDSINQFSIEEFKAEQSRAERLIVSLPITKAELIGNKKYSLNPSM